MNAPTASAKTASELWNALYYWATSVLDGVPVVKSHQDMPSLDGNFVYIDYAGTWRFAGTSASRMVVGREDLPSPRLYTYRGSVQIRDVEGEGDNLMKLVESLENPEVQAIFDAAGISVLRTDGPTMMPALQQAHWRKESLLTLEMTWARAYQGSAISIESVDITQEVENVLTNENENNLSENGNENVNLTTNINEFTVATEEA